MRLPFLLVLLPILAGESHSMAMLGDARDQFPKLVAYLACLGMPVALTIGILGGLRVDYPERLFFMCEGIGS